MPFNHSFANSRAMVLLVTACAAQRVDPSYEPRISHRAYAGNGPVACFDHAHNNSHTSDGLYRPFAMLLQKDGFRMRVIESDLRRGMPGECRLFISVNAAGGKTYKLFGLNLPTKSRERRPEPAFDRVEIDTIRSWVERGGSVLLVADHHPYGASASTLARALGVDMTGGFTEASNIDPAHPRDRSRLVYSTENRLLGNHPIINGRSKEEHVRRVETFTGQSLGSASGVPLLLLGDSAVDHVPATPAFQERTAAGRSQAVAIALQKGRAVIMGEAGALTAQIDDKGNQFGMQLPGNDNEQFALNILHWLVRIL